MDFPGRGLTLNTASVPYTRRRCALFGSASALAVIAAIAFTAPASARARHQPEPREAERVSKEPFGVLPKGPMQIFISINQQKLHLYADGQEVATTLVATGVPQLPTPTGVFSVLEKQKFHRSNIYSGAPMPFMQRITWSGVAMHEGENIGHPASHGCIRMPRDFAIKLFTTTKVGVRVIIAREELKPVAFADPHLFVHKALPPPPAPAAAAPATADPPAAVNAAAAPPEPTRTVQVVEISTTDAAAPKPAAATSDASTAAALEAGRPDPGKPETETQAAQSDDAKAPDGALPVKLKAAAANLPAVPEPGKTGDGKVAATDAVSPTPPQAPATAAPQEPAKPVATTATVPEPLRGTLTGASQPAPADDAVPVPAAKPARLIEDAATSHAPIAIFVSRKTQKIYVRQNFRPMFEAPITIAQPDRPVGTVVFTAMNTLDDGATFRWNVVTFPGEPPRVKRVVETRRGRRIVEEVAERPAGMLPPPQTPAEVLARIEIPQDVADRISQLMVPGSSLVVSDQGLGDETGEGTDFIVVTRQ